MSLGEHSTERATRETLAAVGLYSPYDLSLWCHKNGIYSVYIEHEARQIMGAHRVMASLAAWVVKDASLPGKVIKRFPFLGERARLRTRLTAEAWVEASYDVPMKYLPKVSSSFPAPAVDLILENLETETFFKQVLSRREVERTIPSKRIEKDIIHAVKI